MEVTQKIRAIFPTRDAIPAEYLFETPLEQNNCPVGLPLRSSLGALEAGTRGPLAAISDFLTAMPEKRLPIIPIK